jgi:O-antigen ligase/tetratricopeptide (TPR) repeat protein
MQNDHVERLLLWGTRIGIWLLLFVTPLVISGSLFFPFITGKNFFFRIVIEITFGLWIALASISPQYRPRKGLLLWVMSAFVGALFVAGIFGADFGHSFWSNFERMEGIVTHLHLLALFVMAASVFRTKQDWILTFHVSVAASVVIAFIGLLEKTGSIAIPGSSPGRVFSTLGNPIYLALYLLIHMFLLGVLARWITRQWARIVYGLIFLFELYIFFASGTRGAVIGFAAGLAVGALVFLFTTPNKRMKQGAIAFIIIGIMSVGSLFAARESVFVQSRPLLTRFANISISSATAESRFMIWRMAWEGFKERPILGWGPGNFIIPYAKYYNPNLFGNEPWFDRVHNMHFEWLVTTGIIGFAAYVGLWTSAAILLWRLWRRQVFDSLTFALLTALFTAYLVQNSFVFDTVISYMLITVLLAFLHGLSADDAQEKPKPVSSGMKNNRMLMGGGAIVLAVLVASTLHTKQIQVAKGIIVTLQAASQPQGTVLTLMEQFDTTIAKGTFGVTEARERFMDLILQVTRDPNAPGQELLLLVTKSIDEMEKQVAGKPQLLRHQISLGKLYQLRFALTQNRADRDKSVAVYETAIAMAPHYPPSYIGIAETYLTSGNFAEATNAVDSIYSQMTRPNSIIYSVLLVSVLGGDFERAVGQVERFVSLGNTEEFPAAAYLEPEKIEDVIRRSFVRGEPAEREPFLRAIVEAQEGPIVLMALAETLVEQGKNEEARTLAVRALEIAPPEGINEIEAFIQAFDAL